MGLTPVPAGHVAAVVTRLEMARRPRPAPLPPAPLRLVPWPKPTLAAYRTLFQRIGGPWLWYSRLAMRDDALAAILADPGIQVYAAIDRAGIEVGFLELDFRTAGLGELSYFGLVPELVGQGNGRWLMGEALARLWRPGVTRVGVNTCTLDHPRALGFYRRAGFVAVERRLESFPDPRLAGHLPRDAAPHVPLIEG